LKIKNYEFGRVENFKYLVVILNEDNNNQIDLQERIKNANITYFMLQKFFENKNISKKLKLRLKNTTVHWFGHVQRMEERRVLYMNLGGVDQEIDGRMR